MSDGLTYWVLHAIDSYTRNLDSTRLLTLFLRSTVSLCASYPFLSFLSSSLSRYSVILLTPSPLCVSYFILGLSQSSVFTSPLFLFPTPLQLFLTTLRLSRSHLSNSFFGSSLPPTLFRTVPLVQNPCSQRRD